jgi:UPF0716 protein FxsA
MPFSLIPFMLLAIPIVEIAVFIAVGDSIGIYYTLLMILVTAILGSILLRIEGFRVLGKIREEMAAGRMPAKEMTSGVMILVAGILLLTPGFVTDTIGFLLFLPPVRSAIRSFLRSRINIQTMGAATGFGGFDERPPKTGLNEDEDDFDGPVVDLDEDAWSNKRDKNSPWRKNPRDD